MIKACKRCGIEFKTRKDTRLYCGRSCSAKISRNKKHGLTGTPEHSAWLNMRDRCRNPACHIYQRYGARGITFCERWEVFENFLADMGPKPGKEYSIERIDNDGNYEPSNCKWATKLEQSKNRAFVYTTDEDAKIREAIARGYTYNEMAAFVGGGRTKGSVATRVYRLGLKSGWTPPAFTQAERT